MEMPMENPHRAFKGENDVVIAVMGVTGSGKSTLISNLVGKGVVVGHNLQSCTTEVEPHAFIHPSGERILLLDTPGFDDTGRTDADVLRNIAGFLGQLYQQNITLSGIIYLHRITDVRMSGSTLKNLKLFKQLCGEDFYKNVVLTTTMWGNLRTAGGGLSTTVGEEREAELLDKQQWWGHMLSRGSKVFRYNSGKAEALRIIDYLLENCSRGSLKIQREMVDEKKSLQETGAGQEAEREIQEYKRIVEKEIQEMKDGYQQAIAEQDDKLQQLFLDQQRQGEETRRQMEQQQKDLYVYQEELAEKESKRYDKLRKEQAAQFEAQRKADRKENEKRHKEQAAQWEAQRKDDEKKHKEQAAQWEAQRKKDDKRHKDEAAKWEAQRKADKKEDEKRHNTQAAQWKAQRDADAKKQSQLEAANQRTEQLLKDQAATNAKMLNDQAATNAQMHRDNEARWKKQDEDRQRDRDAQAQRNTSQFNQDLIREIQASNRKDRRQLANLVGRAKSRSPTGSDDLFGEDEDEDESEEEDEDESEEEDEDESDPDDDFPGRVNYRSRNPSRPSYCVCDFDDPLNKCACD